jgi:hypothetical protein
MNTGLLLSRPVRAFVGACLKTKLKQFIVAKLYSVVGEANTKENYAYRKRS